MLKPIFDEDVDFFSKKIIMPHPLNTGACPGIRKRGGPKSERLFFFAFQFFRGGPAQKRDEKIIFSTKKVAKDR